MPPNRRRQAEDVVLMGKLLLALPFCDRVRVIGVDFEGQDY